MSYFLYMSNEPQHPGEYVRQHVIPSELNVTEAAKQLDVSRPTLSKLINGNADLSPEMAARLEATFGTPARKLLDLQSEWDAAKIRKVGLPLSIRSYVPPFLQIKATNIENWGTTGITPRQRLSVFLRTLVNSTGSGLEKVDFPGNDDSETAGWDGEVVAAQPTQWIPAGRSGWEFGVTQNIKGKADTDFAKCVKSIDPTERKQITFVFVTPRRWPGKAAWIKEHKAKGLWRDVRALDASDLEQWLEQSLAGQTWFASETGQEAKGAISLDQVWRSWSADCDPALSISLFTDVIKSYKLQLKAALVAESYKPVTIAADSRDEALAFLSAAFAADDIELGAYRDRFIVFREPGSLSKLAAQVSNFIPVILSREVEQEFAPFSNSMPSFLIYPRNSMTEDPDIVLEPLSFEAFSGGLHAMGLQRDHIEKLSRESGRSLTVLRRRLSKLASIRTPEWASNNILANGLIPFAFAGVWKSDNRADTAMLELLAGEISYQELERRIAILLPIDATPVWSGSSLRGVISKIDVLFAIKDAVTIADLQRFFDVAKLVLAEENPALELPEKDRWAAGIYGKTRQISGALRNGLAETLVLLAVYGRALFLARLGFDAELHVNNLVRNLLTPLTAVTLESQTENLPLYAEAAPETFLSIIEADLQLPEPEALNLMRPIGHAFFSSSPRTGLLWALEGLAWSPTLFLRTVLVLGRLAERRIEDNLVNKPSESLGAIFRSWMPQTSASLNTRKVAFSKLAERFPTVAWPICVEQFSTGSRIGHRSHKARWRSDGHGFGDPISGEEANEFAMHAFNIALSWPAHTTETICDLIGNLHGLGEDQQLQVWDVVDEWIDRASEDNKIMVREKIRASNMTRRAMRFRSAHLTAEVAARARQTYSRLEPADPILRHAWLFRKSWVEESADDLEDDEFDFRKRDERVAKLREAAVREVFELGGTTLILRLADLGEASQQVGWFLATILVDDELLADALVEIARGNEVIGSRFGLLSGALTKTGIDRPSIVEKVVLKLESTKILPVLTAAPFVRSTWKLAASLDKSIEDAYWQEVSPGWSRDEGDLVFAVERLIESDRPRAAFEFAHLDLNKLPPLILFDLLSAVAKGSSEAPKTYLLDQHDLRRAFQFLNDSSEISSDSLASLELQFIEIFDNGEYRPVNLERRIEGAPELFVQALVFAYKRDDDQSDPEELFIGDTEQQAARATTANKLLDVITRVPAYDKSGEIDPAKLVLWVEYVRASARKLARLNIADQMIGKLLSHAPADEDGIWPVKPVRDAIEQIFTEHIGRGISVALFNARGAHFRGDGGFQERELAAKYASWAESMEYTHPRLATLLREMERSYLRYAEWEDSDARVSRRMRH